MSNLTHCPTFSATSAGGAMLPRQIHEQVIIGLLLAGLQTSAAIAPSMDLVPRRTAYQTTTGVSVALVKPAGNAISELRRLSGLTWDQLGRLFNVSRRALHFWVSGGRMSPSNEESLQRLLALVRKIDRGSASANRAILLRVREDGSLPFDLLAAGDYDGAFTLLGPGDARRVLPPTLSPETRAARAPLPPEALVDTLQDRIHRDRGPVRAAKSVRIRSVDKE
ncbi:MAG: XRE family transcriptional regulator [Gammaproteobacteria bacterium]